MKRYWKLLIIGIEMLLYIIFIKWDVIIPCMFKRLFGWRCPTCGMTRALKLIWCGKIGESLSYNILGVIVVTLLVILNVLIVVDVIKKRNYLEKWWLWFSEKYVFIIVMLVISMIVNNIRQV